MTDSKTHRAGPRGLFGRLKGKGGSASVGYSSVVSFRRPEGSSAREQGTVEDCGAEGLFVAHDSGVMPRDPVAHPKLRPRLEGAAKPLFLCEEPAPAFESRGPISKTEVDIAAFVEVVTAAYPQPRDPDVRPVLKARPKEATRPFVYLPGAPEEESPEMVVRQPAWDSEAMQRAHKESELKAFHEFLDRMESGPLEALDRPLADLDEKAEESRQFAAPAAPYDPILEGTFPEYAMSAAAKDAPPLPEEDRFIVEAVIEPQDPVAKPRLPHNPAEVLPGGLPQRLSPSQRAHLKRPVTVRDRHGRIAPVTYSLNPKGDA